MENILDRLKIIADNEHITLTELERSVGASKGTFRKGSNLGSQWIQRLVENNPLYNADWILLGRGEMYIENIPKVEVTDNNRYLIDKLIESTKELKDKDVRIKELEDKITQLEREKKELFGYDVAAEPSTELKEKK